MGATTSAGEESKEFQRPESGAVAGRCIQVVELGTHDKTWQEKTTKKKEIFIVWEIAETMDDGRPFVVNWRGTNSLSDKSNLYKMLSDWRGKPFTEEEKRKFELKNLLDKACLLNIVTETSRNGKEYTNVKSIMPLPKGMTCPERVNDLVDFGISDLGTKEFEKLYPWVQKIVLDSDEGKRFTEQGEPFKDSVEPEKGEEPDSEEPPW